MRGKKAKAIRKEARRHIQDSMDQKLQGQIPIAGCPMCECQQWYLELDVPAPNHTYIENFICASPTCNQKILAHVNIHDTQHQADVDAGRVEDLCDGCQFDINDCQCEA
jgi:hypothetical protein